MMADRFEDHSDGFEKLGGLEWINMDVNRFLLVVGFWNDICHAFLVRKNTRQRDPHALNSKLI